MTAFPNPAPDNLAAAVQRARDDLSRRLRAGEPCRSEEYLDDFSADGQEVLELLYTEFVVRQELGEQTLPEEWYERFPGWRTDLEELFEVHQYVTQEDADTAPERDTVRAPEDTLPLGASVPLLARRHIGDYEILAELGRGGMGVVYRARQRQLQRDVALKMMLAGEFASVNELTRFRNEAHAAARLIHPNIAQVFEAGQHDGHPYLSMELVEGTSLETLLAKAPLTARSAAEVVAVLARAMHYAHEHGIVHRDLKPSNVLFTSAGIPKIVDFGLAKQLRAADAHVTATGVVLGTPSYLAPEQARGESKSTTPAVDIYALGVILFEALTGRPPFVGDSPMDTLRQVMECDAPALRQLDDRTPRDLETIALKCLDRDPAKRFTTAGELADELQRYLDGKPIHARPIGPIHRLRRWCQRKPALAVLIGLLMGLSLITAVGGYAAAWRQHQLRLTANREREKATIAATIAEDKAAEAKAVADFLVNVFRSADPGIDSRNVTVAEKLEEALQLLDRDFSEDSTVKANLLQALADTLYGLGLYEKSVRPYQRAFEIRQQLLGADSEQTLLSKVHLGRSLRAEGKLDEGRSLLESAVDQTRKVLGAEHDATIQAEVLLGQTYYTVGEPMKAVALLRPTYDRLRLTLGDMDPRTVNCLQALALALEGAGDVTAAAQLLDGQLERLQREFGDAHLTTLEMMHRVAGMRRREGAAEESLRLQQHVYKQYRLQFGETHGTTLTALNNVAVSLRQMGRYEQALPSFESVYLGRQEQFGAQHPHTLAAQHNLAVVYEDADRHDEALAHLAEALQSRRNVLGDAHPETLQSAAVYGAMLYRSGSPLAAIKPLEDALTLCREKFGEEHGITLELGNHLGAALVDAGQATRAIPLLEVVATKLKQKHGAAHFAPVITSRNLSMAYERAYRTADAIELLSSLSSELTANLGPADARTITMQVELARLRRLQGDLDSALRLLDETLDTIPASEESLVREARLQRALVWDRQQRFEEAAQALRDHRQHLAEAAEPMPHFRRRRLLEMLMTLERLASETGDQELASTCRHEIERHQRQLNDQDP